MRIKFLLWAFLLIALCAIATGRQSYKPSYAADTIKEKLENYKLISDTLYPSAEMIYKLGINKGFNKFIFREEGPVFSAFFQQFDKLVKTSQGEVNILHIGDSHIQADMMTGRIRSLFYKTLPGLVKNRGFMFPYAIAGTNHPFNYTSEFSGSWKACRNVEKERICRLGVGGMSAFTNDKTASFNIYPGTWHHPNFSFSDIKVLHHTADTIFDIELVTSAPYVKEKEDGYTRFVTSTPIDTLHFRMQKNNEMQNSFETYGILAGYHNAGGITYNAIGVNGATVSSFLKCYLLEEHLRLMAPHLVIISLGLNDAHDKDFCPQLYKARYDTLITRVRQSLPEAAILLLTNSDSYTKDDEPNYNSLAVREVIYGLGKTYENCAVWDMYILMGGPGSILLWQMNNLAKNDKVHFNRKGYEIFGDLFFAAFLQSYLEYVYKTY